MASEWRYTGSLKLSRTKEGAWKLNDETSPTIGRLVEWIRRDEPFTPAPNHTPVSCRSNSCFPYFLIPPSLPISGDLPTPMSPITRSRPTPALPLALLSPWAPQHPSSSARSVRSAVRLLPPRKPVVASFDRFKIPSCCRVHPRSTNSPLCPLHRVLVSCGLLANLLPRTTANQTPSLSAPLSAFSMPAYKRPICESFTWHNATTLRNARSKHLSRPASLTHSVSQSTLSLHNERQ